MAARIRSHAKVNLGLAIGPLRPDGYHPLTTLYQTLAIHDVVTVEARRTAATSIAISSNHPRVPRDASNTAWRMVERALALGIAAEVHIDIDKRLPVQGGLGGGSANAVAALVGLEEELRGETQEPIPPCRRFELAEEIGSDVPLFLVGGAVVGRGRGEQVSPLPDLPSMPCVVALPETAISTPQAFRDWDAMQSRRQEASLTGLSASATIEGLSRLIAAAFGAPHSSGVFSAGEDLAESPLLALVRTGIENDFERVVFSQYPFLGEIKRILWGGTGTEDEAVYAALSGSGSALFGLYRTAGAAQASLERLRAQGAPALLTRTLPREEYWRELRVTDQSLAE